MKCAMCADRAEVTVSWPASAPQEHDVCDACAHSIWDSLSTQFSGTEAFMGFTIMPIERHNEEVCRAATEPTEAARAPRRRHE